ncbi:hypothetical protein ACGFZH_02210 [Streptomyces zaomyceticus]|uniref:hypothetical protein n=1 Tax=Streptomyces zaomyceticus TaxID=68286 RepID=UPI0037174A23
MARENRDRQGGPSVAVPAQRSGHRPTTPPTAPEAGASPPPVPSPPPAPSSPPPPTPPPAAPPQAPRSAVPSGDPVATGRTGGSRTNAPAATPAAPRGRDTTARPGEDRASGDGRGPGPGDRGEHDGGRMDGGPRSGTGHEPGADGGGPAGQLLDDVDRDLLGRRLHRALAGFVDSPQGAVEEAAEVLAAAEETLIASLRDRRAALRAGWQDNGGPDGPGHDTEQLRLTLRTYREVTERLLRA